MKTIFFPRPFYKDVLSNKFEIKHTPILDTKNEQSIEKLSGAQLRFSMQSPLF